MSSRRTAWILFASSSFTVIIVAFSVAMIGFVARESTDSKQSAMLVFGSMPMQSADSNFRFTKTVDQNDLGGRSYLPGGDITWRSESQFGDLEGTNVASVVQATIDRLSFLQQSAQACDRNAKVLLKLMEAKDILDGESSELSSIHKDLNQ